MRIAMIGSGYVGLVSGACLAEFGHDVVCVDTNPAIIAALTAGQIPIFEPGLQPLVASMLASGRLRFTTDLAPAVAAADVVFIAVGTPSRRGDGHADLSYVHDAAAAIAGALSGFTVVVTKSTVPVGTGDAVERIMHAVNPVADVVVVANPEFLREGAAIEDFKRPDRIVIGTKDERARAVMAELYSPLRSALMFTDRRSAELTKYAGNAFLAMKISFINEIADLCERTGADVQEIARGLGLDNRIGPKFLDAGPGYGGSCFPKDTLALVKIGQDHGSPMRLVETTIAINEQRKSAMGRKIVDAMGGDIAGKTIGILGLTFKPNTDDMRDAPSIAIIAALQDAGATLRAYDPQGMAPAKSLFPTLAFGTDAYDVATGADCLVLITEWHQFRSLDLRRLKTLMATPLLVDLRNLYRPTDAQAAGLPYISLGRPTPAIATGKAGPTT